MSKELGQTMKAIRKRCELTQKQVADALHIDRSTYAYYEKGTTEPDLETISKLSRIFKVDPKVFLPDEDGKPYVYIDDAKRPERPKKPSDSRDVPDIRDEKIYSIAKDERGLLALYRTLSPEQKIEFIELAQKFHREQE